MALNFLNKTVECPNCKAEITLNQHTDCYKTMVVGQRVLNCTNCNESYRLKAVVGFVSEKI